MASRPEVLIRTSERTSFKRCRQSWHWAYNDKLKPHYDAPALRFGTLIHKALELRYPPGVRRGPHPTATFRKLYEEELQEAGKMGFRDEDGNWQDMGELGEVMLDGFIKRYDEEDKQYKVLAAEQVFMIPCSVMVAGERKRFGYVGTIDVTMQDRSNGRIFFRDYKTAKSISTGHLALDEQAGAYWTYGPKWLQTQGILKADQTISHIQYIFLRKAKPDAREKNGAGQYLNKDGTVSKNQPPPLFQTEIVYRDDADRRSVHQRVLNEVSEIMQVRSGDLAVYKNPGPFTCSMCAYKDMCELHESNQDWEAMRDATMQQWLPYEAHDLDPKDGFRG